VKVRAVQMIKSYLVYTWLLWQLTHICTILLQHVSIACYAKRCISYCKSVHLSVTRWHCVKTTQATIMGSSLFDSPMTLVSSWLTSAQNSKGNLGSQGAE